MTDKEKISWRQQAKLWVLQGILLVGAGISLVSTMAGFHTIFFPHRRFWPLGQACSCRA